MFTKTVTDYYDDPWHTPGGKSYDVTGTAMCRSPKSASIRARENLRSLYKKEPELSEHTFVLRRDHMLKGKVEIVSEYS